MGSTPPRLKCPPRVYASTNIRIINLLECVRRNVFFFPIPVPITTADFHFGPERRVGRLLLNEHDDDGRHKQ